MKARVFVSYAHADMRHYPGFNVSRVGQILEEIKHNIRAYDPRSMFEILRDAEGMIDIGEDIDREIERAIGDCDIGLVLLSESYCRSEECEREFLKLLALKKPLFVVETQDVWSGDFEHRMRCHFNAIERTLRAAFWGIVDNKPVQFGWPLPQLLKPDDRQSYDRAMQGLVDSLKVRGAEILRERRDGAMNGPETDAGPVDVLLSYPSSDVRRELGWLEEALVADGLSVLRFDPKLHVRPGQTAREAFTEATEHAAVVVQFLGGIPLAAPDADGRRLVHLQHDVGVASGKRFLIWRSPDFDPADCGDEHRVFLGKASAHLTSYDEFQQYALKEVRQVKRKAEAALRREAELERQGLDAARSQLVSIDVAEPDLKLASALFEAFRAHPGIAITTLPFDIDRSRLEQEIADNDGIVIVYGDSREGQTRASAHFRYIHRSQRRNNKTLLELAIGDGLSAEGRANALPPPHAPGIHVIAVDRNENTVDPDSLAAFLAEVRDNADQRTLAGADE